MYPAVIAAQQGIGLPTRTDALYVGGVDVLKQPGSSAAYGVSQSTIRVTEAGPGQVSSMEFVIDDPTLALPRFTEGLPVRFHDLTLDMPIFAGWIESLAYERLGVGTRVTVTCVGVEALLDWLYVPALTVPANTEFDTGWQLIASAAYGIGQGLNQAQNTLFSALSSYQYPIGTGFDGSFTSASCAIPAGTLRQALQAYGQFLWSDQILITGWTWSISVDFGFGLRIYRTGAGNSTNDDAGLFSLTPSTNRPSNTSYGVNAAGVPRQVWVSGSGSGSGMVTDGSGLIGPTANISDANSTDAVRLAGIGRAYLAAQGTVASGTTTAEGTQTMGTMSAQRRAGCWMDLQDPQAGIPTLTRFAVTQVVKTWANSGEETWRISFGSPVPQASNQIRRLTRSTLA
jgi:hypothetical protein